MKRARLAVMAWGLGVALMAPTPALACTLGDCQEGFLLPEGGATIPANAPGLLWVLDIDRTLPEVVEPTLDDVALVRTDGESEEDITVTLTKLDAVSFLVTPTGGFVAGASYELRVVNFCEVRTGGSLRTTAFEVGDPAEIPSALGTLSVSEVEPRTITIDAPLADGGCFADTQGVARDVTLSPSTKAAPWLPLLMMRKDVDDHAWSGYAPSETTVVYRLCDDIPTSATTVGLPAGDHEVVFVAKIPGLSETIPSEGAAFELRCGPGDLGPGEDAGDDDAGADGGVHGRKPKGGGCAIGNGKTGTALPFLVLVLVTLSRRRRA